MKTIQTEASPQTDEYSLFNVESWASPAATKPLVVEVIINGQTLSMEVDTGSAVTLVSEGTHSKANGQILFYNLRQLN